MSFSHLLIVRELFRREGELRLLATLIQLEEIVGVCSLTLTLTLTRRALGTVELTQVKYLDTLSALDLGQYMIADESFNVDLARPLLGQLLL